MGMENTQEEVVGKRNDVNIAPPWNSQQINKMYKNLQFLYPATYEG